MTVITEAAVVADYSQIISSSLRLFVNKKPGDLERSPGSPRFAIGSQGHPQPGPHAKI